MAISRRGRFRARLLTVWATGRGSAPGDELALPENTVLPRITSNRLVTESEILIDAGEWELPVGTPWAGDVEVRLQTGATLAEPGTIQLDWTVFSTGVIDNAEAGQPCYIAARPVVGGTGRDEAAVINPQDFGPWEQPFEPEVVLSMPLRATLAYVSDVAGDTPLAIDEGPWAFPVLRNGVQVGWTASQPPSSDRSTTFGSRLAGSINFNTTSRRFRVNVPGTAAEPGHYLLYIGMRTGATFTGIMEVFDGDPHAGGTLLATIGPILSADGSGNARDATNAIRSPAEWNEFDERGAGAPLAITVTSGSGLWFRRVQSQTGTEVCPLNYVGIDTREPPQ